MNPASHTFTLAEIITILIATVGGVSVLGAIFATGVWYKFLKDRVRLEIVSYQGEPETRSHLEKVVIDVIDNQISRRDGIVYKEISKQVTEGNDAILEELKKLQKSLLGFTDIAAKINHIEGSMSVIMGALRVTPPPFPALKPPLIDR